MKCLSLALTIVGFPALSSAAGENCTFLTHGGYEHGVCTFYGACRIKNKDYMYQGGCEEVSSWGEKVISKSKIDCKIWRSEIVEVKRGVCDGKGNCIMNSVVNKTNPQCVAYNLLGIKKTIPRRTVNKVKLLIWTILNFNFNVHAV